MGATQLLGANDPDYQAYEAEMPKFPGTGPAPATTKPAGMRIAPVFARDGIANRRSPHDHGRYVRTFLCLHRDRDRARHGARARVRLTGRRVRRDPHPFCPSACQAPTRADKTRTAGGVETQPAASSCSRDLSPSRGRRRRSCRGCRGSSACRCHPRGHRRSNGRRGSRSRSFALRGRFGRPRPRLPRHRCSRNP